MLKKLLCAVLVLVILFIFSSCDKNSFFYAMTGKPNNNDEIPEIVSINNNVPEEQSAYYCPAEGSPGILFIVDDCYFSDNLNNTGLKKDSFVSGANNFSKINNDGTLTDENLTFVILNIRIKKMTEDESWHHSEENYDIQILPDFRLANDDYSKFYGDDVCIGFNLNETEDITRDHENDSHFRYYSLPYSKTANAILGFIVEKTDVDKISRLLVNQQMKVIDDGKSASIINTGIRISPKER